MENGIVVLVGLVVPSEKEKRIRTSKFFLTNPSPQSRKIRQKSSRVQGNHVTVYNVAGSYDYSEAVQKSVVI